MPTFTYTVRVESETVEQADQVMAERLDHDEDYGFDYTLLDHERIDRGDIAVGSRVSVHDYSFGEVTGKVRRVWFDQQRGQYTMLDLDNGHEESYAANRLTLLSGKE